MKKLAIWNQGRGAWEDWDGTIDLFSEHSESFSAIWPSSGMTRDGVAYVLPTPALPTVGTESSFLPTPRASRGASGTETIYMLGGERSNENRTQGQVLMPTPEAKLATSGPDLARAGRPASGSDDLTTTVFKNLLPTPVMTDSEGTRNATANRSNPDSKHHGGYTLTDVLLPTPTVQDGANTGGPSQFARNTRPLNTEVLLIGVEPHPLPTPAANDSGNTPENHLRKKPGRQVVTSLMVMVDYGLLSTGGRISPQSSAGKN